MQQHYKSCKRIVQRQSINHIPQKLLFCGGGLSKNNGTSRPPQPASTKLWGEQWAAVNAPAPIEFAQAGSLDIKVITQQTLNTGGQPVYHRFHDACNAFRKGTNFQTIPERSLRSKGYGDVPRTKYNNITEQSRTESKRSQYNTIEWYGMDIYGHGLLTSRSDVHQTLRGNKKNHARNTHDWKQLWPKLSPMNQPKKYESKSIAELRWVAVLIHLRFSNFCDTWFSPMANAKSDDVVTRWKSGEVGM